MLSIKMPGNTPMQYPFPYKNGDNDETLTFGTINTTTINATTTNTATLNATTNVSTPSLSNGATTAITIPTSGIPYFPLYYTTPLSATVDAKGTFTPLLSNFYTPSYSLQAAIWTKVGNIVFLFVDIRATSNVTGTVYPKVAVTLPYPIANGSLGSGSVQPSVWTVSSSPPNSVVADGGGTLLYLKYNGVDADITNNGATPPYASINIQINAFYFVTL